MGYIELRPPRSFPRYFFLLYICIIVYKWIHFFKQNNMLSIIYILQWEHQCLKRDDVELLPMKIQGHFICNKQIIASNKIQGELYKAHIRCRDSNCSFHEKICSLYLDLYCLCACFWKFCAPRRPPWPSQGVWGPILPRQLEHWSYHNKDQVIGRKKIMSSSRWTSMILSAYEAKSSIGSVGS